MPLGRSRNKKNVSSSSSSSYTSTITTIAFVAVCVVGVWMLTSNSIVPPQTTTRTGKTITSAATTAISTASSDNNNNNNNNKNNNNVELPSNDNEPSDQNKNSQPAFEDNPEEKVDSQPKESTEEPEKQPESKTQISEESTVIQKVSEENPDNGEQSRNQNSQQNENGDTATTSVDSTNQEANTDQEQEQEQEKQQQTEQPQQQEDKPQQEQEEQKQEPELKQEPEKPENGKENAYEQQQEQQRKEDAGIQMMNTPDPRNELSEEDQQERLKQQQQQERETQNEHPKPEQTQQQQDDQQQQQQQQENQQHQQEQHQYDDRTSPKKDEIEDKKPENETDIENQKKQQEGESTSVTDQEIKNETKLENKANGETISLPGMGTNAGIPKESKESKETWSTQAKESENQKERRKEGKEDKYGYDWELCNVTAGPDYIPCLDNELAIKKLKSTKHFQHRERHCPPEGPTCLVSLPPGYKKPILWPASRDKIWYHNVPHTLLAAVKGHQNWVKVTGEFLTFPGGGTQFIHGAMHYINFIQSAVPNIKWGKNTRVILDVGCGVASFGGYLFEKDVLTMSFAPKDEHEAQVQFALERGIPAISAVMGSQRLQFPSRVFDLIHCARCRVPWHEDGGMLLLELNRMLRPGGYFVWSATPVYQKIQEDVEIWKAMSALTVSMCWELVTIKKDKLNSVGAAIYRKPKNNNCYDHRKKNFPPMCESNDDPNAAWYVPLHPCMHRVPTEKTERGTKWPVNWPSRVETPPYWLNGSQMGIYGKPAPQDFTIDFAHWHNVVKNSYMKGLGISWSGVRNVMDMRAVYGGFAAALRDLKMWVMNVVNVDSPDTLPIIYERGLFGIYHDWCESFSTYPRTYDLLHADHLFSRLKKRCRLTPVMAEVDRITRPGGKLIVRDESNVIGEVEKLLKSLRWEVHLTFSKDQEGLLSAQKGEWRPQNYSASPW
ncbi:S-adenosyl-L-methionine-dependent methyltransferases superfamily protein [Euphorbia peplus]|nr:S-adenosyl-L-methionine-dependent methyltransferases superfamily protein [Euphorbia peplus]